VGRGSDLINNSFGKGNFLFGVMVRNPDTVKQAPRNFVFTYNNYGCTDAAKKMVDDALATGKIDYLIVAKEVGESGTPHLQGYCELTKPPMKFAALKKMDLFNKCHLEKRAGKAEQAADYCRKGEQSKAEWDEQGIKGPNYGLNVQILAEYGELRVQGKRSDLEQVYDDAKAGKPSVELAESNPGAYIKYYKGIEAIKDLLIKPRDGSKETECICYYGPTGTGKTRKALADHPGAFIQGPGMGKWFDGYQGEEVVIFDEYRGQLPFGQLLRLMDRYRERVERKGGSCQFAAKKIIFTMPEHPKMLYTALDQREGKLKQLKRRFTKVYKFGGRDPADPTMHDVTGMSWEEA